MPVVYQQQYSKKKKKQTLASSCSLCLGFLLTLVRWSLDRCRRTNTSGARTEPRLIPAHIRCSVTHP